MNTNKLFDDFVENFKLLPINEKKNMVNEEMKKLLGFIEKANSDLNLNDTIMLNKEILDLNKVAATEDDFVEAILVYTFSIREAIAKYFNQISKILYK